MKNLYINRKIEIGCGFSADQWKLHASPELDAEHVASQLNNQLVFYVNTGYDKKSVLDAMETYMKNFSMVGADQPGPWNFLNQVLDAIYAGE